jgi:cation transport ATPase
MERNGVDLSLAQEVELKFTAAGHNVSFLAIDGLLHAVFAFIDVVRPGLSQIVRNLKQMGVRVRLITKNPLKAVREMAQAAGMEGVIAELPTASGSHKGWDAVAASPELWALGCDPLRDLALLQKSKNSIAISEFFYAPASPSVWLMRGTFADLVPAVSIARAIQRIIHHTTCIKILGTLVGMGLAVAGIFGGHGPLIAAAVASLLCLMIVLVTKWP